MSDNDEGEQFTEAVRSRVRRARADLAVVAGPQDGFAVRSAVDEREDTLALAHKKHIEVPAEARPEPGQDSDRRSSAGNTGARSGRQAERG